MRLSQEHKRLDQIFTRINEDVLCLDKQLDDAPKIHHGFSFMQAEALSVTHAAAIQTENSLLKARTLALEEALSISNRTLIKTTEELRQLTPSNFLPLLKEPQKSLDFEATPTQALALGFQKEAGVQAASLSSEHKPLDQVSTGMNDGVLCLDKQLDDDPKFHNNHLLNSNVIAKNSDSKLLRAEALPIREVCSAACATCIVNNNLSRGTVQSCNFVGSVVGM